MAPRKYRDLRAHNVRFYDPHGPRGSPDSMPHSDDLPQHVKSLMDTLLHFDDILDPARELYFQEHPDLVEDRQSQLSKGQCILPPVTSYYGRPDSSQGQTVPAHDCIKEDELQDCHRIANRFRYAMRSNEEDLTVYYLSGIFQSPDIYKPTNNTGASGLRPGAWTMLKNVQWIEDFTCFGQNLPLSSPDLPFIAASRPDLAYGIRMVISDNDDDIRLSESFYIHYDNFKFPFLAALRQQLQVQSIVRKTLSNVDCSCEAGVQKAQKSLEYHDRMCFPFAIIEFKRGMSGPSEEETCECQAAAAAVRALSLPKSVYERTLWQKKGARAASPLPCCITFTCTGTDVKVWLAYEDTERTPSGITMRCIYFTTMLLPWGVISLRNIIRKMLIWSWDSFRMPIAHALQTAKPDMNATTSRLSTRGEGIEYTDLGNEDIPSEQGLQSDLIERHPHTRKTAAEDAHAGPRASVQDSRSESVPASKPTLDEAAAAAPKNGDSNSIGVVQLSDAIVTQTHPTQGADHEHRAQASSMALADRVRMVPESGSEHDAVAAPSPDIVPSRTPISHSRAENGSTAPLERVRSSVQFGQGISAGGLSNQKFTFESAVKHSHRRPTLEASLQRFRNDPLAWQKRTSELIEGYAGSKASRAGSMVQSATTLMDPLPPPLTDDTDQEPASGHPDTAIDNDVVLSASPAQSVTSEDSDNLENLYAFPEKFQDIEAWRQVAYKALCKLAKREHDYYFGSLTEGQRLQDFESVDADSASESFAEQDASANRASEESSGRDSLLGRSTYFAALLEIDLDALSPQQIDYLSFHLDTFVPTEDDDADSNFEPDQYSDTETDDDSSSLGSASSITSSELAFVGPYIGTKSQTIYLVE